MENGTPEPRIHRQESIDMPQTSKLIVYLLILLQRQLIVQKDEKGEPAMKMHGKVERRENNRNRFLNKWNVASNSMCQKTKSTSKTNSEINSC